MSDTKYQFVPCEMLIPRKNTPVEKKKPKVEKPKIVKKPKVKIKKTFKSLVAKAKWKNKSDGIIQFLPSDIYSKSDIKIIRTKYPTIFNNTITRMNTFEGFNEYCVNDENKRVMIAHLIAIGATPKDWKQYKNEEVDFEMWLASW